MRVFVWGVPIIVLLIGLIGVIGLQKESESETVESTATLSDHYKTLDDLISDSNLVVIGNVGDTQEALEYLHAKFALSQVKIDRVIMGPPEIANNTVRLLELNFNVVNTGGRYLLFLKRYEGPVSDDAYVVTGAYQGKFKIEGNRVDYVGNNFKGVDYFQSNLEKLSLDEVIREVEKRQGFTQ